MAEQQHSNVVTDDDDGDYDYTSKWEYLGKGIWENQVRDEVIRLRHESCLAGLRDTQ